MVKNIDNNFRVIWSCVQYVRMVTMLRVTNQESPKKLRMDKDGCASIVKWLTRWNWTISSRILENRSITKLRSTMIKVSEWIDWKFCVSYKIILDKEAPSQSNSVSGGSSTYDSPPVSPTPESSPPRKVNSVSPTRSVVNSDSRDSVNHSDQDDPEIDPSIPDATHWTPDEVYDYFKQYFPEEAKVFKEQVLS